MLLLIRKKTSGNLFGNHCFFVRDVRDVAILSGIAGNCLMVFSPLKIRVSLDAFSFSPLKARQKKLSKIDALKMMSNCCPGSVFKPRRLPMNIAMENPPFKHISFPESRCEVDPCELL